MCPVSVSSKTKSQVPTVREHIAEKPSLYYVTLKVRNRAGKRVIIAPSYKGLNEGFHINNDAIMKITREFQSSEPLLLRAFDPDSHSAMMINNRKSIIVKTTKIKEKVTDVVTSPLSKWNIFLLQIGIKVKWYPLQTFISFLPRALEYLKNDWCNMINKNMEKAKFQSPLNVWDGSYFFFSNNV